MQPRREITLIDLGVTCEQSPMSFVEVEKQKWVRAVNMSAASDSGLADLTAVQQMISSCSGAMLTSFFVTPLDVVKIRMQAQQSPQSFTKGQCYLYCNGLMDHTCFCQNGGNSGTVSSIKQWYRRPGNFTNVTDAFIRIGRNEGLASLWSGLPPTLVMAVPATVVYFTCYEQIKAAFGYSYSRPYSENWWKPIAAGSIARVFAVSVISPLELIRTKLQSEQLSYRQLGEAVRNTVRQNGIPSLWRGLVPTLLRDIPFSALYWFSYESMKSKVMAERNSTKLTFMESFVAGAVAGTTAGVLTLPFDVIKTHRQIELGKVVFGKEKKEITSTWRLIQNLYRQQGFSALFTGLTPRVMKVAPACAIMISTFEFSKSFFRERNLKLQNESVT